MVRFFLFVLLAIGRESVFQCSKIYFGKKNRHNLIRSGISNNKWSF